jgi:esterase
MKTLCVRVALAIGILLGAASAQVVAALDWPIPSGVKTVDVNGYPIAYIEAGAGVPIIMLHGAWVDHRFLAPQVAEFSKTHRAIAVSLRHHYPEPWDGTEGLFSVSQHAADVTALIRQLNLGKVHLLGHSRGGAVAINVARQAPELIRTLILEDAGGLEPLLPEYASHHIYGAASLATWVSSDLQGGDRRETAHKAFNMANGSGVWERISPDMQQMITDNIGTFATKMPYDAPAINCDDIAKFTFPILTLHGDRSPKLYGDMSDAMRKCKPDLAADVIVPDAAHNMHFNNPTFFNKVVLEFLERN